MLATFVIAIKNIASYILLSSHILSWLWANSLWNHIYCTCVMVCLLASMLDSFSFYHVMVCVLIIRVHAFMEFQLSGQKSCYATSIKCLNKNQYTSFFLDDSLRVRHVYILYVHHFYIHVICLLITKYRSSSILTMIHFIDLELCPF